MNNTNNIFFRVNDTIYNDLNKIKNNYKFRSIPELVNTIVKVFCDLYANKKDKEETIEDMFRELEDGEGTFTYEKPKKIVTLKSALAPRNKGCPS